MKTRKKHLMATTRWKWIQFKEKIKSQKTWQKWISFEILIWEMDWGRYAMSLQMICKWGVSMSVWHVAVVVCGSWRSTWYAFIAHVGATYCSCCRWMCNWVSYSEIFLFDFLYPILLFPIKTCLTCVCVHVIVCDRFFSLSFFSIYQWFVLKTHKWYFIFIFYLNKFRLCPITTFAI